MGNSKYAIEKAKQTEFYEYVGKKLKYQRKSMIMTQEDLSFVFGISRVSINNIENGKQRLPLHLLVAISDFLFIPLSELVPKYDYNVKTRNELHEHKISIAISKI